MNLLFFLAVSTWRLAIAGKEHETFEMQPLFKNNRMTDDSNVDVSKSLIRFSIDLYKAHANVEPGYFALPTASLFVLLSLLRYGAEGSSLRQLNKALHFSTDYRAAQDELRNLVDRMKQLGYDGARINYTMLHAYGSDLEDSFMEKIDRVFGPSPHQRFESWNEIASGKAICEWFEDAGIPRSQNHTFEGEESLVLASAATFTSGFLVDKYSTRYFQSAFYYNEYNVIKRYEFAEITAELLYGEFKYPRESKVDDSTARFIELPWTYPRSSEISTIIVLPNDKNGIVELEESLDEATINYIVSNTRRHSVVATLPRFIHMESASSLTESLQLNEHLAGVFDKKTTDFRQIIGSHPIKVGPLLCQLDTFHIWMNATRPLPDPRSEIYETFQADHTFIILHIVKDEHQPLVLSMGRFGWVPGV